MIVALGFVTGCGGGTPAPTHTPTPTASDDAAAPETGTDAHTEHTGDAG